MRVMQERTLQKAGYPKKESGKGDARRQLGGIQIGVIWGAVGERESSWGKWN